MLKILSSFFIFCWCVRGLVTSSFPKATLILCLVEKKPKLEMKIRNFTKLSQTQTNQGRVFITTVILSSFVYFPRFSHEPNGGQLSKSSNTKILLYSKNHPWTKIFPQSNNSTEETPNHKKEIHRKRLRVSIYQQEKPNNRFVSDQGSLHHHCFHQRAQNPIQINRPRKTQTFHLHCTKMSIKGKMVLKIQERSMTQKEKVEREGKCSTLKTPSGLLGIWVFASNENWNQGLEGGQGQSIRVLSFRHE